MNKKNVMEVKSLDMLDKETFNPAPSPMDGDAVVVTLQKGAADHPEGPKIISLDGTWEMAEGGTEAERLTRFWSDSIPARVPGSVHTALLEAGEIPDPYVGFNDEIAREKSFKTWWFKCKFQRLQGTSGERLIFGGICDSCTVWLNGQKLGSHKGMFGGPEFDIADRLADGQNILIVKLDPAPYRTRTNELNDFFKNMNVGWLDTVVFNNVYGWHYINLPALGIWRSVKIEGAPAIRIIDPFVAAKDAEKGVVRLYVNLEGNSLGWTGRLICTIEPDNFEGPSYSFSYDVSARKAVQNVLLEFTVLDPRLWWPVDLGDPNLYRLKLSVLPEGDGVPDFKEVIFGIRKIEMRSLPKGPDPALYNWTFVINGRPVFVKGANWCTLDALMRFDRARYDRFLTLAKNSHIQLLRAWGSGMPETDEFYDSCNRKGIMVLQEWPTAWNSHKIQPYDILEETVRKNIIRLRNNPSLIMWGGGNESNDPIGPAIDMMGLLNYELDGTRPFHRAEPWGGSIHNYDVYWGRQPLERNLKLTACFIGEFGLASVPNYETVQRYLPNAEKDMWPAPPDGSFAHHTPVFNQRGDMAIMSRYVSEFVPNDSMRNFIIGMQMAQATGIRHTLELARTRWPEATGVVYYKLTDNNPAASWSTVDWYGVPKFGYYVSQDCYQPLHACVLFERLSSVGEALSLPVYLLDDADELTGSNWRVIVRAYNAQLEEIRRDEFPGDGSIEKVLKVGNFDLSAKQTQSIPLLIVAEVRQNDELSDRTFYWINYNGIQGSLFGLPKTTLTIKKLDNNHLVVKNEEDKPAVAVNFHCPSISDTFTSEDNFFWLDPGEQRSIMVNETQGVGVKAWNSEGITYPDP